MQRWVPACHLRHRAVFGRKPAARCVQAPPHAFETPLSDQSRQGDARQRQWVQVTRPNQTLGGHEVEYSLMVGNHRNIMFRNVGNCQY
jgi:hypothetical protein